MAESKEISRQKLEDLITEAFAMYEKGLMPINRRLKARQIILEAEVKDSDG